MSELAVPMTFEGRALEHVLVQRRDGARRPGVIIFPTVAGVSPLEIGFAEQLNHLGYTALVADLYGTPFRNASRPEKFEEMKRLRADRGALARMLTAVLDQMRTLDSVEPEQIAAIGYCFGGLCALDLARTGAEFAGVASFHGLFDPSGLPAQPIRAKVLACHGWDDPMVPPRAVVGLAQELTAAGADWQIHAYGHTRHGFTNPDADKLGAEAVRFNALAADRAWTSLVNFLEELFG